MEHTKVLLVEDDLGDVVLTLRAFRRSMVGGRVYAVRDGVEALDFLLCRGAYVDRDSGDMPELVLLDMQLPRLNGLQVLRRLRAEERTRRLPVVILTSSDAEHDRLEACRSGVNSYLRKPVDSDQYFETVQEICENWLVLKETPPQPVNKEWTSPTWNDSPSSAPEITLPTLGFPS